MWGFFVNRRIPPLTKDDIITYLDLLDKQLDKKATQLYDNHYVDFICSCEDPQHGTYFKAQVKAEMKSNIVYRVDILVNMEHVIEEAQCECAAGMGPRAHCKHVVCVLYGLSEFVLTRTFKTVQTCTQQLQTFHQAKKHNGSPVKARDLPLHVGRDANFDPRPPEMRGKVEYLSFFRNGLLNCPVFSSAPILQAFMPANPYAVNTDHDYMELLPSEKYLLDCGLVSLSEHQITVLEESTRQDSRAGLAKWKLERSRRMCSSNFGRICRLTERTDRAALAKSLVSPRVFKSRATDHGKKFERVAVELYEEEKQCATSVCGLHVSKEHPFLASTPDRRVSDSLLLEVKCPFTSRNAQVCPKTVPYLVKDSENQLALKQTHCYFYQVQGQMMCTSATAVDFMVYHSRSKDNVVIRVERDDDFIEQMQQELVAFYASDFKVAFLEKFFFKNYREHFC